MESGTSSLEYASDPAALASKYVTESEKHQQSHIKRKKEKKSPRICIVVK